MGLLHRVHQFALMIGLEESKLHPERIGTATQLPFDIGERGGAVDRRLATAEEIQVRTVEDQDAFLLSSPSSQRWKAPISATGSLGVGGDS